MSLRPRPRSLVALAFALALTTPPLAASAHVRLRTPDGVPLRWRRGCPSFTIAAQGGDGLDSAAMAAMIAEARDAWTGGPEGCDQLPIEIVSHDGAGGIEYDGTSLVLWRAADHCDAPAHRNDEVCLSPNAAAVTTVFYIERGERAGELLEADLEINGALRFATDGSAGLPDLRSTLTHELGHALGLEHTCDPIPGRAPLVDSDGARVPSCFPSATLPPAVVTATMYPFLTPGDLQARTPLPEERDAICTIYGTHAGRCEDTGPGCGCGSGPGRTGAAGVLLWIAIVAVGLRLRPRRQPTRTSGASPAGHRR